MLPGSGSADPPENPAHLPTVECSKRGAADIPCGGQLQHYRRDALVIGHFTDGDEVVGTECPEDPLQFHPVFAHPQREGAIDSMEGVPDVRDPLLGSVIETVVVGHWHTLLFPGRYGFHLSQWRHP